MDRSYPAPCTASRRNLVRNAGYRSVGGLVALALVTTAVGWHAPAQATERLLALGVDAGVGSFASDASATFQLGLDVREGNLAIGLYGRLRLLLSGEQSGSLRERDFDEPSDFVHILRYLHYRRHFGQTQLRVGAGEVLGFTLGQGTLLRDYSNVSDPDHPHAGALIELDLGQVAVRALVDNVLQPAVIGGRLAWRPRGLERFSLAASAVVDPRAPRRVQLDEAGQRRIDGAYNLEVDAEVLVLTGLDLSYQLGGGEFPAISPYVALNTSWRGVGAHAGISARVPLGASGVALATQLEYRGTSGGYAPGFIGPFYDVARYQTGLNFHDPERTSLDQRATPLANLHAERYAGHGFLGQVGVEAGSWLQAKLGYDYHPGPSGQRMWLRVSTNPVARVTIGAMAMLAGIGAGMQRADGLAILSEGRYHFAKQLYALAQFSRVWAIDARTRYYALLHSFNLGVGGTWSD